MSEEKFGVENLQKVLKFGVDFSTAVIADAKDGFNFNDIIQLLPQLMQITDFIKNKDAIINEAKDLSFVEIQELVKSVEGVIKDEQVVSIIENALAFVVAGVNLVNNFTHKATTTLA